MTDTPDPSRFKSYPPHRPYRVRIQVEGTVYIDIQAGSREEARLRAQEKIEGGDGYDDVADWLGIEGVDIDGVSIGWVTENPRMYAVIRDGKRMGVSHLHPGDEPRELDEWEGSRG